MVKIAALIFGGLSLAATTTAATADYWERRRRALCEQRGPDYSYWNGRCTRSRPFYRERGRERKWRDCGPGAHYGCGVRGCRCYDNDPNYRY